MNFMTPHIEHTFPSVLGISANISLDDLVALTNQQRAQAGLPPLTLDAQLTKAASLKAADMMAKNYWAHNAPDGTTPWVFIKSSGYEYLYAGENLARGFTTAQDAVNAWMASPGHRSNILSPNYKDVGFAVVTGMLTGDDTVLIVEEFGERMNSTPEVATAQKTIAYVQPTTAPSVLRQVLPSNTPVPTVVPTTVPTVMPLFVPEVNQSLQPIFIAGVRSTPLIDKQTLWRNTAILLVLLFIFVFVIDRIIIQRKQIVRLVTHNMDHVFFLIVILLTVLFFSTGIVL